MRFQTRSRHVIDLVFPIALFFVFAASSLAVLILAANLYKSTTGRAQANDESRTVLSYISQKMRQNDVGGMAELEKTDGRNCLVLTSSVDGSIYKTYVYDYDGTLKELFVKEGVTVSLKSGKDIMEIGSLKMDRPKEGLFRFTSIDRQGNEQSIYISERSAR